MMGDKLLTAAWMPPRTADRPFALPVTRSVIIELAGDPIGKGRPRFSRRSGTAYTPDLTRQYETALRLAGQAAMRGAGPIQGPVQIEVLAAFSVPKSWPRKKQVDAHSGIVRPTGKPDYDNVGKIVGDALNGVAWSDDSQIVTAHIAKRYSNRPRLWISVEAI